MLLMKYFSLLFLVQTNLKDLAPVLKPASICGMDSVNGKTNSGCLILKVGNVFLLLFLFSHRRSSDVKSRITRKAFINEITTTTALTSMKTFMTF